MAPRTYSASDVARYFRFVANPEIGDLLSNLKLQKLCYYAQGLGIVTRGVPLFNEGMEAWQHGPVVPALYHEYKEFGAGSIPNIEEFDLSSIDAADRKILDDVYGYYGQYSAWKLREMTHQESPWLNAYDKPDNSITLDALRAYFEGEVSRDYVATYNGQAKQ